MKGPWTAEFTDTPYEEIGESWVVDGPDGSICTIDCPLDERESVAHLIAAAPDLYEALAELADPNGKHPAHKRALAALSRARGEEVGNG